MGHRLLLSHWVSVVLHLITTKLISFSSEVLPLLKFEVGPLCFPLMILLLILYIAFGYYPRLLEFVWSTSTNLRVRHSWLISWLAVHSVKLWEYPARCFLPPAALRMFSLFLLVGSTCLSRWYIESSQKKYLYIEYLAGLRREIYTRSTFLVCINSNSYFRVQYLWEMNFVQDLHVLLYELYLNSFSTPYL